MSVALRAFVVGMGAVSPAGGSVAELRQGLLHGRPALAQLGLFSPGAAERLPVGEVSALPFTASTELPRSHALALLAATEALAGVSDPPDAVVIGVTTGGITTTEELLRRGERDPAAYHLHAAGSVAELLARQLGCPGPALTVSTACSSAAVALQVALRLCRSGRARTVLAGGVDALCRLTYHGFRLLQLCDPAGARPLDCCRKGMSVAEGAALLLLQAAAGPPPGALAELRGGGLSCDAYHPTKPQPEGEGAKEAMARALADGDAGPQAVGYVNLHGTGTPDNDAAEAKAVRALFAPLPPVSSTKGLTGHTLAAAGALEAVISVLALQDGLLWPNVGLGEPDPALALEPVLTPVRSARPLDLVLSNSFGFGGNNAALLLGRPELPPPRTAQRQSPGELRVLRSACFTGAGDLASTLAALRAGQSCSGLVPAEALQQRLPPALTRRLKRLPRLVLALAEEVRRTEQPRSVFCGTAWGALSETYDFLDKLHASQDQFSSPTDFVGSVHNAPAAQVAMRFAARGANVTATSRATSFEQAVLLASLLAGADDEPLLLLAADEAHGVLGPLFDPRAAAAGPPADGGGALLCAGPGSPAGVRLRPAWLGPGAGEVELAPLLDALGGAQSIARRFAALLVGFPEDQRDVAEAQLAALLATSGFGGAVVRYRPLLGRYGTAAAAAAAAAVSWVEQGALPAATAGGTGEIALQGRGLLLLTLGEQLAAIEVGG